VIGHFSKIFKWAEEEELPLEIVGITIPLRKGIVIPME
jgi:hypothetical protein